MSKSRRKNGTACTCVITGRLGRSEEPSPSFTITGEGRELSCIGGKTSEFPVNEVRIDVDLRDENLFLEKIPLGTEVVWTELRAEARQDFVRSCSIKVLTPRRLKETKENS